MLAVLVAGLACVENATTHQSARPTASHGAAGRAPAIDGAAGTTCGTAGRIVTYRVSIEKGLPITPAAFAGSVRKILCDRRSWIGSRAVRFRYDPAGSLLISLRTPAGTESRCQRLIHLSVALTYSCGTPREVVINAARWLTGSPAWPGPLSAYRTMVVNHETGHALGLGHQSCPAPGAPAPVMMQQSKGLTTPGGNTCAPNPWPLRSEWNRLP
jgi:hypothetical protein